MDNLPPYDNNPPGIVMFEPFLVPQPTVDLLGGVTLADVQGTADTVIITHGVGRQRGRAYVSVRLTGVFADATGTLWKTVSAKQVPSETAIAGIPGHLWRFEGRLEEDMARERLREHRGYAARPWFGVVWAVFHRLDPAMGWAGHTRSAREKAWLTLARATAVAAGELRTFMPAWYSYPLVEAVGSLYPGHDCYAACARQWLGEQPDDWPQRSLRTMKRNREPSHEQPATHCSNETNSETLHPPRDSDDCDRLARVAGDHRVPTAVSRQGLGP